MPDAQPTPELHTSSDSDVKKNKTMAMLAYILFFLPLIASPDSRFARYHANQGLCLWIFTLGLFFLTGMFGLNQLALFAYLVFLYVGITHARNGEMKPLPGIGSTQFIK